ncbi:uncharacterized protein LOC112639689 [Camponotus floridanus]|uniref:uncharacterized protein LOC112639689 n=1 Tax=Camponotus floridanus TaxID=104421 RepID=UPI000DC67BBA|nr:uncharacterized protein LOC112639689 [Camponotus floridanus]
MCSNASREMISIEDRYFNLNRILLLTIGLWPYQKSAFTRFQSICFFSIEAILIISQFTIFLTSKFTIDIVIKILSPAFACIGFILTYNSFYINDETVIYLMKQLQLIYDDIKDNNEFMIIEKYGNNAKYYTISLITSFFFMICVHISAPIWSDFFDVILTAEKFRHRHIQTNFVKQKQYSQQYLRQLYINVAYYVGIAAVVATGTMLITYFQHFCGLFRIANYRIKNAMQNYISQDINLQKRV